MAQKPTPKKKARPRLRIGRFGTVMIGFHNLKLQRVSENRVCFSLKHWMKLTNRRWSVRHRNWNSKSSKKKNKVSRVVKWNSNRPTEDTLAVMRAIVQAVVARLRTGVPHGKLLHACTYMLHRVMPSSIGAFEKTEYTCTLSEPTQRSAGDSLIKDVQDLHCLLFYRILRGKKLPNFLSVFDDRLLDANWVLSHLSIVYNHPALWSLAERYLFFETLHIMYTLSVDKVRSLIKAAMDESLLEEGWDEGEWMELVPDNTPLKSICKPKDNTGLSFYYFIRLFLRHVRTKKNNKFLYVHDASDYLSWDFALVCIEECFPHLFHNLYIEMCEKQLL